jgi:hypothetical protein
VQTVEEVPAYPFQQLISETGGVCGLYLGITAVAFFEVLEILIMGFVHCFKRSRTAPTPDDKGATRVVELVKKFSRVDEWKEHIYDDVDMTTTL